MTADMFPDLLTKNERRELLTLRVERDAYQTQAGANYLLFDRGVV